MIVALGVVFDNIRSFGKTIRSEKWSVILVRLIHLVFHNFGHCVQ